MFYRIRREGIERISANEVKISDFLLNSDSG